MNSSVSSVQRFPSRLTISNLLLRSLTIITIVVYHPTSHLQTIFVEHLTPSPSANFKRRSPMSSPFMRAAGSRRFCRREVRRRPSATPWCRASWSTRGSVSRWAWTGCCVCGAMRGVASTRRAARHRREAESGDPTEKLSGTGC